MKLPQLPPAGRRYREDTSLEVEPLPDPTESWRPTMRAGVPQALVEFTETRGALPLVLWHMLFLVAAHRLRDWAGPLALEALHEDWVVLLWWWWHRPADGAEQRAVLTQALEEMLARPKPAPSRGQKRHTSIAPRMLLVKYDFCRREIAVIQKGLASTRRSQSQDNEWRRRLNDLAEEVALFSLSRETREHIRATITGAGRAVLTKKQQARLDQIERDQNPADAAGAVLDCLFDLSPAYLRRKVLPQARRSGTALTNWMSTE